MKTEVLLAIENEPWELDMGKAISEHPKLKIARRCVDVTEILTMLEVSTYELVIISSELINLDLEIITKIRTRGSTPIGVFNEGDFLKSDFLRSLGLTTILEFSSYQPQKFLGELILSLTQAVNDFETSDNTQIIPGLICIWGTDGAPGRTSISIDIASALHGSNKPTLLIDADAQAPSIGTSLGISEEVSGISSAIHLAQSGKLDHQTIEDCLSFDKQKLPILTGITKSSRWMELRNSAIKRVLEVASKKYVHQIIDLSSPLPDQRDSSFPEFDSLTRFGHLPQLLRLCETLILVVKANPLGVIRAADLLSQQELVDFEKVKIVVNQVDTMAFHKSGERLISEVLTRFVPANRIYFHKHFPEIYAKAWLSGVSGYSLLKADTGLSELIGGIDSRRRIVNKTIDGEVTKFVA